jgi:hypothetical protein
VKRVALFGVPRSGTSWAGAALAAHAQVAYRFQPLHSYSFPGSLSETSDQSAIDHFFSILERSDDPYVHRISLAGAPPDASSNETAKESHLLFKEVHDFPAIARCVAIDDSVRLIGLVRDPIEVLKSWINAPGEWNSNWKIENEWLLAPSKNSEYAGNHFGINQWLSTTRVLLQMHQRYRDRVMVVRYRELKANPSLLIDHVLRFVGLEADATVHKFLQQSAAATSRDKYSVYRGRNVGYPDSVLDDGIIRAVRVLVDQAGLGEFFEERNRL